MRIRFYLLAFIFFKISGYAFGQERFTVNHYTSENGLPQNSIKDIAADSDGFIWLATEDGLVRFDGRHFKIYNSSHLKAGDNRIISIKHGLHDSRQNGRNKQLYAFFLDDEILQIEKGCVSDGTTYFQDKLSKMRTLDKGPEAMTEAMGSPSSTTSQTLPFRYKVYVGESEQDFYVCDYDRVSYYRNWKKEYEVPFSIEGKDMHNYFSIGERLYFLEEDRTVTHIVGKRMVNMPLSGEILRDPGYKTRGGPIRLFWDNDSDQAFLSLDKNLYILDQQKDGRLDTKLLIENFDLEAVGIREVHFDRINGKVYLGSLTRGLFVLSKQQFSTLARHGEDLQNVFYAQSSFTKNTVITPHGFVIGKDNPLGKVSGGPLPAFKNFYPADQRSIIREKSGMIWTQRGHILFQIDSAGKNVVRQWPLVNEIKSIYQANGQIWLGVIKHGLFQIDPRNPDDHPQLFVADPLTEITYLQSLTPSALLAGTKKGLYTVDMLTKKVTLVPGTEDVFVKSIYVANPDQIWITAMEKGLMLINKGNVTCFPLDKNKYLASPHCIVNDGRGYLWIPTNRGLFQMSLRDLVQYAAIDPIEKKNRSIRVPSKRTATELFYGYHTMEEGFNTNEFNGNCQPCAIKLDNGYISLPSLNGLVWFKPEQVTCLVPEGDIVLDKAEVNLKAMVVSGDTLNFPANPENIRLDFTTPYSGNDYNLNLSYALVSVNTSKEPSAWIPINTEDFTVRYSSLRSGNYVLLIKKLNGFGLKNYTLKKIYFHVPPVWYETVWAILFYVLTLILAVYFYVVYRLRKVTDENARLEGIISLRTLSLEGALSELQESKSQMSGQVHVMSRLLASISHDVQSPLHFIASASGDIPDLVRQGQLANISQLGTMISELSSKTNHLLEDLLDYVKIQVYGNSMHFEPINLKDLIDGKLELFKSVIARKGNHAVNEIADTIEVTSDYHLLCIVIHNLIDNAVKYSSQGEIRIYTETNDESAAELVISNPGNGISQKMIEMINATGEKRTPDQSLKNTKITGLGLLIVKELADLIGIKLMVKQTDRTSFHLIWNDQTAAYPYNSR